MSTETIELYQLGTAFLFPPETMAELTEPERRGEFTLERLEKLRPEVIPEIVKYRGRWVSQLRIAKAFGVSVNTVAAVDAKHAESIESLRLKRVELWEQASDQLVAQIASDPDKVPWQVKALAASQLRDKAELMAGRATARIESTEPVDIQEQYRKFMAERFGIAANARDAEAEKLLGPDQVRELPAMRSLDGEKLTIARAPALAVAVPGADASAGSDLQSPTLTREEGSNVTSSVTSGEDSGPDSGAGETPRGGDQADPPGAGGQSHNCTSKISDNAPDAPQPPPL